MIDSKLCQRCNTVHSVDRFSRHCRMRDGYQIYCKDCMNAANRLRLSELKRINAARNPYNPDETKRCFRCKTIYSKTPEYFSNRIGNPDGLSTYCITCSRETSRQFARKPESIQVRKNYLKANPEMRRAISKRYKENNLENVRRMSRDWNRRNPESVKRSKALRRARQYGIEGAFTREDVAKQMQAQKQRCHWCSAKIKASNYHVDHRIPLARGGSNGAENIVISCPSCNLSKNARMPWEFNGRLL